MKSLCRNCKHYDIDAVKSETGRVMSNRVASCKVPIPELPESIKKGIFRGSLSRSYMQPNDGETCSGFEPSQ